MSYTPTTWQTGDTITATAMNKIENGIANAGSALVVQTSWGNNALTCDHTVQEIYDALTSGTPVFIAWAYGTFGVDILSHTYFAPVTKIFVYSSTNVYYVCTSVATSVNVADVDFAQGPAVALFSASSANSYPVYYKIVYPQTSIASSAIG